MNFYKTSLLTSAYTAFNMLSGIIITKVTATLIGPIGTAYIGEFGNVVVILTIISTGAIGTGIVKYVAEFKDDPEQLARLVRSALGVILAFSIPMSIVIMLAYKSFAYWTFKRSDLDLVFLMLGILLVVLSLYHLVIGIISGLRQVRSLTIVNMVAASLNLAITLILIYNYLIVGALLSNLLFNTLTCLCALPVLKKLGMLNSRHCKPEWNFDIAKKLLKYGVYGAITSMSTVICLLIIRNHIVDKLSLEQAGLWQGMYSLSERYLSVIYAIISVYYLPTLAALNDPGAIIREVRKGFKRILPLTIGVCVAIYLLRDLIIDIFMAESFRPMRDLFAFQMVGDVIKVAASLFGYIVLAKAMIRTGLKAEISFVLCYLVSSIVFINKFGLVGTSYAFAFSALFLFLVYSYFFRDLIVRIKKSVLPKPWIK